MRFMFGILSGRVYDFILKAKSSNFRIGFFISEAFTK